MFLESIGSETGWIEVICGSMFSGKTEELIRRVKRAEFAQQKVEIFKPLLDTRYDDEDVVSHNENSIISTPIDHSSQLLLYSEGADVVAIDEAQFFDNEIVDVCNTLANSGKRVIIAGLDMDYLGNPFGPMPYLMAIAEYVTKVHAICVKTGQLAHYSHRKMGSNKLIELGEKDEYEPLSRKAYWESRIKEKRAE